MSGFQFHGTVSDSPQLKKKSIPSPFKTLMLPFFHIIATGVCLFMCGVFTSHLAVGHNLHRIKVLPDFPGALVRKTESIITIPILQLFNYSIISIDTCRLLHKLLTLQYV